MKNKIALFLAILMTAGSLAACAESSSQPVVTSQNSVVQSQTEAVSSELQESSETEETSSQEISKENSQKESVSSDTASSKSSSESKTESSLNSKTSQVSKDHSKAESGISSASSQSHTENSKAESVQESKNSNKTESTTESKTESKSESKPVQTSTSNNNNSSSSVPEPSHIEQSSVVSVPEQSSNSNSNNNTTETDIGGIALYRELFNLENTVTINISMEKSEIDKLQADYKKYTGSDENKKSPIYRMATVSFTVGSQKYIVEEVGIRLKGNQSMEPFYANNNIPNLCSFKLSFDETFDDKSEYGSSAKVWTDKAAREARKKRKFASMNELDIKWNISYDNTNIREVYATKLFESADVLVQKIGLSQVKINGNNYGLMKIYEPVDKTFLEKRLPESAIGGDLYKCMWSECNNSGVRTGRWRGATYKLDNSYGIQDNAAGKKYNFNLKTNKKTSKHESLKNFLNIINKSNVTKNELESVLDVDYFARFMAASYFAGDPDDIRNNYNNHYIYFRKDTGKAIFIVYDNDRTLGITYGLNKNCATRNPYSSYAATQGGQENPLIKNTISHSPLSSLAYIRDKYAAALQSLSQTPMLTSDADFNKLYHTAKKNYESILTPYTRFANQKETFKFSLDGNKNGGDNVNMSFEQFRSQIMDTYKNSQP